MSDNEFKDMRDRVRQQILATYDRLKEDPGRGSNAGSDFVARYYQFHRLYEMPCEDIEEAVGFLASGVENGRLVPENITRQDGTVVLDKAEALARIDAMLEEWHAE